MRSEYEKRPEFPKALEPEGAIYEGFLDDADCAKVSAVRGAGGNKLADFHPDFRSVFLCALCVVRNRFEVVFVVDGEQRKKAFPLGGRCRRKPTDEGSP